MLYRRKLKRMLDVLISSVALVILSPLLLAISLAVFTFMGRPVFFRQLRPGRRGQVFKIVKFRTMKNTIDEEERLLPDSTRLTSLGRFLRSTSLDELPELLNVVRGDMSIVGPRPLLVEYLDRYSPEQARRHDVLPGITGWAQVNGRNGLPWTERFRLDVWYVDHLSWKLDAKIVALTLWKIIRRDGINEPGHATATPFEG
jgi:sugar transferase EpsL